MERLTQCRIIDAKVSRDRVEPELGGRLDTLDGALDLVEQGQHRAGIVRIPFGYSRGKDKARGRFRRDPGLSTKLSGAIALAFEDRSDGEIVGIDQFAVAEFFPLRELGRLLTDMRMTVHRHVERLGQTLACSIAQRCRLRQELLGLLAHRGDRLAQFQELLFRVAHQFHEDVPVPAALTPKATHDFGDLLVEAVGLALHRCGPMAASLGDPGNHGEGFFCALYNVVASVTRWLPCSHGKVSMTRCAGLTRPSSMAAAAWMAISSSMSASSMRPRNSQRVSGSTKCTCERGAWYSRRPQAYITAKSVRKRWQMSSSDPPSSCLRSSRANNTRMGTGRRPRRDRGGKRWAKLCSIA